MRNILEILKVSATPPTIIYPLYLAPLAIFSLEPTSIQKLAEVLLFSSFFQAAVNLWNHVNDVKEDKLAGRKWSLLWDEKIRRTVAVLAVVLYILSGLMVYFWQIWEFGISFFFLAFVTTWLYSDKVVFGRFIRRFKEHYVTEISTYVITIPSYVLAVWSMLSSDFAKGLAIATTFLFLMLSAALLKDLKDISADREAGLLTLGVVFHYKTLLKSSFSIAYLYYISISLFASFGLYPKVSIISVISAVGLIYSTYNMWIRSWEVDNCSVVFLKIMIYSTILSLVLLITSNIIFA